MFVSNPFDFDVFGWGSSYKLSPWKKVVDIIPPDSSSFTIQKLEFKDKSNIEVKDGKAEISLEIPGVKKEEINVSVLGKVLTVEYDLSKSKRDVKVVKQFKRQWSLPSKQKLSSVKAHLEDGILTISLQFEVSKQEVLKVPVD